MNWRYEERAFVVRTNPAREVPASVAITALGFPVFLPMRTVERSHAGKREKVARPLFPRYLFTTFVEAEKTYGAINFTRGVNHLLCDLDGIPIPIPAQVLTDLRARERAAKAKTGEVKTGWEPGDVFRLRRGRYAEFDVTYMGEEKGEVTVLVRMFNRDFPVQIAFAEVPICEEAIDRMTG